MTDEKSEGPAEAIDVHFVALVNLLAQMAAQLLQEKRVAEARGLIDGLSALEKKTAGNLEKVESQLLESVLYQLRMAAVSVPGEGEPASGPAPRGTEGDARDAPGSGEPGGADPS